MEKGRHLKLFRDDQGQALVEGSIGVALMAFTWTLLVVLSVMTTNIARTAMAARHAAWLAGNGANAAGIEAGLRTQFFFHTGTLIDLAYGDEEEPEYDADDDDVQDTIDSGNGPYKATVRFGAATGTDRTTKLPWSLISTIDLPFMPPLADLDTLYQVDTACQWEEVGDTWLTAGDAIEGIFNELKKIITDVF